MHAKVTVMFLQTTNVAIIVHAPLLLLHSNSLVLDDLRFYYEEIYVIFIYEFNGCAIYEMEAM